MKCSKDKICNVTEKKCIPKKEEMEIHNINGYEVIGDKYIIEKLQKILKSDNEFDVRKKGINYIRKCFGLSVYQLPACDAERVHFVVAFRFIFRDRLFSIF